MTGLIGGKTSINSCVDERDRIYRETAGFMTDLCHRYSWNLSNISSIQVPRDGNWSVTLGYHTLNSNSITRIGWLVAESEGMDLGKNC